MGWASPQRPSGFRPKVRERARIKFWEWGIHDGRFWRSFPSGGFLMSAAENGASIFAMMDVSRHRSMESVKGYVRRAEEFEDHAGSGLL